MRRNAHDPRPDSRSRTRALVSQDLRLQDNRVPGTIPDSIGNLLRLRYLDLYNNRIVGDVPASIANLTNLKELYLQNEQLTPVRNR